MNIQIALGIFKFLRVQTILMKFQTSLSPVPRGSSAALCPQALWPCGCTSASIWAHWAFSQILWAIPWASSQPLCKYEWGLSLLIGHPFSPLTNTGWSQITKTKSTHVMEIVFQYVEAVLKEGTICSHCLKTLEF